MATLPQALASALINRCFLHFSVINVDHWVGFDFDDTVMIKSWFFQFGLISYSWVFFLSF